MSFADFADGSGGGGGAQRGSFAGSSYQSGAGPSLVPSSSSSSSSSPSSTFDQLHSRASSAVFEMNSSVHEQARLVSTLGTRADTHDLRERLSHAAEHTRAVAKETGEWLTRMNQMVSDGSMPVSERRGRKTALGKVHRDFSQVLTKFEKVTRESGAKMRESVARAREGMHQQSGSGSTSPMSAQVEERISLIDRSKQQQLLQSENEIVFNESLIAEREEGIREVEATVGELAEIFRDMAVLVNEQGQMIDDIDANVGNAAARTEAAVSELDKANKYQKKSRNKMCCIIIFVVLLGLGLALIFTKGFQ